MGLFYNATDLPDPNGLKLLGWLVITAVLFGLALYLEDSHPEASTALLNVFEVTFPSILVLLGIETFKAKS